MNHAGGMEVLGGNGVGGLGLAAPSDPVELRRLNFQTPGHFSYFVFFSDYNNHLESIKRIVMKILILTYGLFP